MQLKQASRKDFLEHAGYTKKGSKNVKKWKPFYGVPYWMFNSKGVVEPKPYIFTENTDMDEFADYLNREQILISK